MRAQMLEASVSIISRNGAPSPKGCVVNGQMTTVRQATHEYAPPPAVLRPPLSLFNSRARAAVNKPLAYSRAKNKPSALNPIPI